MSWLRKISDQRRTPVEAPIAGANAKAPAKPVEKAAVDVSELAGTMVSSKVLAEHGAVLEPCAADMKALAELAGDMEGWRATQYSRAVERFYGALGKQLSATPAQDRTAIARASIAELRGLVLEVGPGELLSPAISTLTDLVAWTSRKEPGVERTAAAAVATVAAIREQVSALLHALEGRAGAGTALNVYSSLIWQAEKLAPNLPLEKRAQLWSKITTFIADASPRAQIDQVGVASLSQLLGEASPKAGGDPAKALQLAQQAAWRVLEDARKAARAQIGVVPEGVLPGTPAREAFDAMTRALVKVIDENPAGPQSTIDRTLMLKARLAELAPAITADQTAAYRDVATILEHVAATPVAEPVLLYLKEHLGALAASQDARGALQQTAALADAAAIPAGLIRAHAGAYGGDLPQLERGMEAIAKLSPSLAMRPALALLPRIHDAAVAGPLASALASFARQAGATGLGALPGFCDRFAAVYPALHNVIGEQAQAVASAIASTFTSEAIPPEKVNDLAQVAATVQNVLGDLPIAKLMLPDRNGRPGLLALTDERSFRFDPRPHLYALLPAVAMLQGADPAQRLELARHAIHVAAELGKLDRNPEALLARARVDLEAAIGAPDRLQFGARAGNSLAVSARALGRAGARRKDGDVPALKFLQEHPAYPVEVAFTAGLHLSADQNGWVHEQVATTKSRAHARALRDTVFACVEANRTDVIEAMRASPSPAKALVSAAVFIAQEYRAGRLGALPFDQLAQMLREGKDPVEEIEAERARAALAGLNLQDLGGAKPDPAGVATLGKLSAELNALVGYVNAPYKQTVVDVMRKIADGSWPKVRYESELAKRQLAGLSPKQIAVWAQEMVTPGGKAAAVEATPEVLDAMLVLKGLIQGLTKEVKLGVPGMAPLQWDAASAATLREARDRLLGELHATQKGTPEHRTLSGKLGPVSDNLAAIELRLALERTFQGQVADPVTALIDLKPELEAATRSVRKLGGKGCAGALHTVIGAIPEVTSSPRTGLHAADEDWIGAWLLSYRGGSCVNPLNGENRHALAEFMSTPQYRMLRVCDGEKGISRGQLRLFQTEIDGVRRPAIWADIPYGVDNCDYASQDQQKLFYKHAMAKAQAMGVPLLFHANHHGMGTASTDAANELGHAVQQKDVTMHIDYGITGTHQSEIVAGAAYFVNVDKAAGTYPAKAIVGVVMPPA